MPNLLACLCLEMNVIGAKLWCPQKSSVSVFECGSNVMGTSLKSNFDFGMA